MNDKYEKCDYCGGEGRVVDHGQSRISGQQIGGFGMLKCPRCHGSGYSGILVASDEASAESVGENSESDDFFWNYIFVGLFVFIAAGIGWKIYGITGLQIGAVIGFGSTLLFKFGREVLLHIVLMILVLAMLWGLYIFGAWVLGTV